MKTETLPKHRMIEKGGGVFEFEPINQKPATVQVEPLTYLERSELLTAHNTTFERMNWKRAERVKQYHERGATRAEIAAYLRGVKGCGESMIKRDLAALLAAKRKT